MLVMISQEEIAEEVTKVKQQIKSKARTVDRFEEHGEQLLALNIPGIVPDVWYWLDIVEDNDIDASIVYPEENAFKKIKDAAVYNSLDTYNSRGERIRGAQPADPDWENQNKPEEDEAYKQGEQGLLCYQKRAWAIRCKVPKTGRFRRGHD